MALLTATNIHKYYGNLHVLKGVDVAIQEREVVSIVGSSGAGKSTLLHILGTLDKSDEGEVSLAGQQLNQLSEKQMAKLRNTKMGFVFQFHHLLPEFTALENICIPAYIAKQNEKEARKRGEELLNLMGLSDRASHKPSELSGGEQQRVAVARALVNNPAVVFADEPSGNLDSDTSEDLHQLFFRLRDEIGQTFVIVTHNNILADMADRKLTMKDGLILN